MCKFILRSALCTTGGGGSVTACSSTASMAVRPLEGGRADVAAGGLGLDLTPRAKVSPLRWRSVVDSVAVLGVEDRGWDWGNLKGRRTEVAVGKKSRTASLTDGKL